MIQIKRYSMTRLWYSHTQNPVFETEMGNNQSYKCAFCKNKNDNKQHPLQNVANQPTQLSQPILIEEKEEIYFKSIGLSALGQYKTYNTMTDSVHLYIQNNTHMKHVSK